MKYNIGLYGENRFRYRPTLLTCRRFYTHFVMYDDDDDDADEVIKVSFVLNNA